MAATPTAAVEGMRLQVYHRTEYFYLEDAAKSSNELRLTPKITASQDVQRSIISVLPATRLEHYDDLNCNRVHYFTIPEQHKRLLIESRSIVETSKPNDLDSLPYGYTHSELKTGPIPEECYPYLQNSTYVENTPEIWREAVDIKGESEDVFQTGYAIMDYIYSNYQYASGTTTAATHAGDVIRERTGVCQDFAHAMTAFCRALGIPARYVSGYFYDSTRNRSLRGSEASHAWVEIYGGKAGWIGLDPTNRKVVDDTYIVLAFGRDYRDVAPVIGTYYGGGGSSRLSIRVQVDRL